MRDNIATHILAHAQHRYLREALGDSLLATIISVALGIVVVPLSCGNLNLLHLMEQRTLKVFL